MALRIVTCSESNCLCRFDASSKASVVTNSSRILANIIFLKSLLCFSKVREFSIDSCLRRSNVSRSMRSRCCANKTPSLFLCAFDVIGFLSLSCDLLGLTTSPETLV
ncbi:hypothetical protein Fmac_029373 [Flemingia macrophylla]|uniref:Uncharacterized protein n=1 Tax=Flemingia macrophylla TaxID=520843 RepID=A0ABD1LA54_9FABA